MDKKFRLLNADEIEIRVGRVNEYGVSLLLYKNARADMNILDEIIGPMNWKKTYSRDNKNCLVEIWDEDKKQWVGKEDTGTESAAEAEKGLASDSFKRACVSWGIGRELYTAPEMFIKKDRLQNYVADGQKCKCYDEFSVLEIEYDEKDRIKMVKIGISKYNKIYDKVVFPASAESQSSKPAASANTAATATNKAPTPAQTAAPKASAAKPAASGALFADDEVIRIGQCMNKTYGSVKSEPEFKSFLDWVRKNPDRKYNEPTRDDQFQRFLKLATTA